MSESDMALGEAELFRIGEYVKGNLRGWITQVLPAAAINPDPISNTMLMERVVRIEEELKSQRELMKVRFEAMDQRFEDMQTTMNQRFEAADRRFEDMQTTMNQRFEAVDRRFEDMQTTMNQRFEDLLGFLNKRFGVLQWGIGLLVALWGTVLAFVVAG